MKRLVLYKVKVPKYDRNGQVALVTELSVGCLREVTGETLASCGFLDSAEEGS